MYVRDKLTKGKSPLAVYFVHMQPIIRAMFIFVSVMFGVYLLLAGTGNVQRALSTDRSRFYTVKVIPSELDDTMLDQLPKESFSYAVVIDAGSSGSRAHVYRYGKLGTLEGDLYVLPKHSSFKVKPGLSSFDKSPDAAGKALKPLVDFLKEEVPQVAWENTPIWLKATAGLRMVAPETSLKILRSVRTYLSSKSTSPFLFNPGWAKIIPGTEEGAYGWIAFNYLKKIIGPKRPDVPLEEPYAVVEMGGASAQVTQRAMRAKDEESIPIDYKIVVNMAGEKFVLYTHSYLGYGAEQAREAISALIAAEDGVYKDPCLQTGFTRLGSSPRSSFFDGPNGSITVQGASDRLSCQKATKELFIKSNEKECTSKLTEFSFDCVFQPSWLKKSENILVFENFFWAASGTAVKSLTKAKAATFPLVTTPKNFRDSAEDICGQPWSEVQADYPKDSQGKDNNNKWCFVLSYATSFLIDGLKIGKSKTVTVQREVEGSEIEWALGAVYRELSDMLKRSNLRTGNSAAAADQSSAAATTSSQQGAIDGAPSSPAEGQEAVDGSVKAEPVAGE